MILGELQLHAHIQRLVGQAECGMSKRLVTLRPLDVLTHTERVMSTRLHGHIQHVTCRDMDAKYSMHLDFEPQGYQCIHCAHKPTVECLGELHHVHLTRSGAVKLTM